MKSKKSDLAIDTIGGLGALTLAEEKALTIFFQNQKSAKKLVKKKHLNVSK